MGGGLRIGSNWWRNPGKLARFAKIDLGIFILPLGVLLLGYGVWILGLEELNEAIAPIVFGVVVILHGAPAVGGLLESGIGRGNSE